VSELWEGVQSQRIGLQGVGHLTYEWFVLGLDVLFAMQAIELDVYNQVHRRPTR
jgi:hypothetical protein